MYSPVKEPKIAFSGKRDTCANCGKNSEEAKLQRCVGCKVTLYCSTTCQENHWNQHKYQCGVKETPSAASKPPPIDPRKIWICLAFLFCFSIILISIIIGGFYGRYLHQPSQQVENNNIEVNTANGIIVGFEENDVNKFFGVPYAQPPTGELRWKPPQQLSSWTDKLETKTFTPACPQLPLSLLNLTFPNQSEDCLYLNIWTPSWSPLSYKLITNLNLPVLVWMHGGGFIVDDISDPAYDGTSLAKNGQQIVVSINYRLGVLGFLALKELQGETDSQNSTGNYGIQDTQLALLWIKQNIAQFGGNPNNIFLFGESAGGNAMHIHLASPLSKNLFHSIGIQSGFYKPYPLNVAIIQGEFFLNKTNCSKVDPLSCLRTLPVDLLTNLSQACSLWLPVIDGAVLRMTPIDAIGTPDYNAVPILLGANRDEGTLITATSGFYYLPNTAYVPTVTAIAQTFLQLPQSAVSELLARYPLSDYSDPQPYWALTSIIGDWNMKCSARKFAQQFSDTYPQIPIYLYEFAYVPTTNGWYPANGLPEGSLGAYHAAEIPFIWRSDGFTMTQETDQLSLQMQSYWSQFAASHNPNSPKTSTQWPQYSTTIDSNILFNIPTITIEKGFNRSLQCEIFNPYYTNYTPPSTCM